MARILILVAAFCIGAALLATEAAAQDGKPKARSNSNACNNLARAQCGHHGGTGPCQKAVYQQCMRRGG